MSFARAAALPASDPTRAMMVATVGEFSGVSTASTAHEKSFSIGHLAQLVATMPGWLISIAKGENIDLAAGGRGYTYETTENLLATFDKLVADARAVMGATSDEDYAKPWSLMMGEKVLITTPRGDTVRNTINHLIHHRGQLTVYLRLLDVPVPSTYGPTADEGWGA